MRLTRALRAIALAGAAAAALGAMEGPASAVSQPPAPYYVNSINGGIVTNDHSQVILTAADGSSSVLYTTSSSSDIQELTASPGTTQLAFVVQSSAGGTTSFALDVINNDGSGLHTLLTASSYIKESWSPDGTQLAVVVANQLTAIAADGSNRHSVGTDSNVVDVAWSPDGTTLAYEQFLGYTSTCIARAALRLINTDGSGVRTLLADTSQPLANGTYAQGVPVWDSSSELLLPSGTFADSFQSGNACVITGLRTDTNATRTVFTSSTNQACSTDSDFYSRSLSVSPDLTTVAFVIQNYQGTSQSYPQSTAAAFMVSTAGGGSATAVHSGYVVDVAWERIVYGPRPTRGRR